MIYGERKNIRSDRTLVVPGPSQETAIVREIFRLYGEEKKSFLHISKRLNALGVPRTCYNENVQWTYQAVRQIILNEKYTGTLIWGRYTQKLRSRCRPLPRDKWIVVPNSFTPVVDRQLFDAAHSVWLRKTNRMSTSIALEEKREAQCKNY
jgi:Recombinase